MQPRMIKFDFFKLELPDDAKNGFLAVLDNGFSNSRTVTYRGTHLRVETYHKPEENGVINTDPRVGTIVKIVSTTLPSKAHIRTPGIHSLGLKTDEGVTTPTSFLFAPEYNIIVLQRSGTGARAGAFVHLLETMTGISPIGLNIMLELDPLQRFLRMKEISRFAYDIRVATSTSREDYKDTAVSHGVELARDFAARNVKMEIGMGRKRESLNVESVKAAVRGLLKIKSGKDSPVAVESLVIRGKEFDDERMAPLDLIKERLIATVPVTLTGREFDTQLLEKAVEVAYSEQKQQLERYKDI